MSDSPPPRAAAGAARGIGRRVTANAVLVLAPAGAGDITGVTLPVTGGPEEEDPS